MHDIKQLERPATVKMGGILHRVAYTPLEEYNKLYEAARGAIWELEKAVNEWKEKERYANNKRIAAEKEADGEYALRLELSERIRALEAVAEARAGEKERIKGR